MSDLIGPVQETVSTMVKVHLAKATSMTEELRPTHQGVEMHRALLRQVIALPLLTYT